MKDTLFEILKEESDYITQDKIIQKVFNSYYYLENYHDSPERHALTKVIHKHNADPEADGIIISNNKGVKIATEEEARLFLKRQYKALFKRLKYLRKIEKKINKDGQYNIFNKLYEEFKNDDKK